MKKFNIEEVQDKGRLLTILSGTSIEVPRRIDGRRTEHTERWTICHLLATLSTKDRLTYPLALIHEDKPDFHLYMNGMSTGIEVTESIPTDYARCCAMAQHENPGAVIDMSFFRWGDPPKSTKQLRDIINRSKLSGPGWSGESPEIEWAHHIHDSISDKLYKLNSTGYKEANEYWLAIYDNLPLPNVHARKATEILLKEFSDQWKDDLVFSKIFIERGPIIIEVNDSNITNHEIHDLWP